MSMNSLSFPRRWPLWPTLSVLVPVAALCLYGAHEVRLSLQDRAVRALARANPDKPAVSFPRYAPVPPERLFRRSTFYCLSVVGWHVEAARAADGSSGFLYVAQCSTGAEGPGALVAVGVGARPDIRPRWTGGPVGGWIAQERLPDNLPSWLGGQALVARPMLIAAQAPEPGLKAPEPPRKQGHGGAVLRAALAFGAALAAVLGYGLWLARHAGGEKRNPAG